MLDFLPQNVKQSLTHLNLQFVYELRIRADKPITVNYQGKYAYLGSYGLTNRKENALRCDKEEIGECVFRAGKYSVYSVEEQIRQGFLTAECGERIGLAGEFVLERGQPLAMRNFTSLCVRVPHEVYGSATEIYQRCMSDRVRSLLLMSPPGLGKTTILRDLCRIISEKTGKNLLVCDERGEISVGDVGDSGDVVRYADKATAFEAGVRAMRPDLIVTDELSAGDCQALERAIVAGVRVIASAHFSHMNRVKEPFLGLFERFVLLDEREIGKIKGIYDEEGRAI